MVNCAVVPSTQTCVLVYVFHAVIGYISEAVLWPCSNHRVEGVSGTRCAATITVAEHLIVATEDTLYKSIQH